MLLTTSNSIEGKRIVQYYDIRDYRPHRIAINKSNLKL